MLERIAYLQTNVEKPMPKCSNSYSTHMQYLAYNVVLHNIFIDFEQHMIAALNKQYPLVPENVYLFQFSESKYWHVQELGLSVAASGFLKAFRAFHSFYENFNFYLMFYLKLKFFN